MIHLDYFTTFHYGFSYFDFAINPNGFDSEALYSLKILAKLAFHNYNYQINTNWLFICHSCNKLNVTPSKYLLFIIGQGLNKIHLKPNKR